MIPTPKPSLKRKAVARKNSPTAPVPTSVPSPKKSLFAKSLTKPKSKIAKTASSPTPNLEKFLNRGVVRGKVVREEYFREQNLGKFLKKLQDQGLLTVFTNTHMGCSQPDLAEFYAKVAVTEGVVTSEVSGVNISFDARRLGEILRIPSVGFDIYV